jgi:hypothetical protein
MDWLNSANAIASLVLAVFGIGGYIYGIATYLKKKASQPQQSSPTPSTSSQTSSIPRKPISWLGWIELFTQGFVNTANFILGLFPFEESEQNKPVIIKIGYCAMFCALGAIFGEIILGFAIGIFLSFMGMSNPTGAAVGITTVLLFMTFSLVYIYHVGLLVEEKQLEDYRQEQRQRVPGR